MYFSLRIRKTTRFSSSGNWGAGATLRRVETPEDFSQTLASEEWDIVFADYSMPQFSGRTALAILQKSGLDLPFIFVSGTMEEETAVAAMKAGAHDFILKGNLKRLVPAVERELREALVREELRRTAEELRKAQEELERRVAERTSQLAKANLVLQQEIANRNRAEKELRLDEVRFRLLVERVQDYAIFLLDPAGHVASWNAGAEHIKGYRQEEILGESSSRFYLPEDVKDGKRDRLLQMALAEGRVEDEGWRVRKDGSRFWADVVITALRDADGNLRGFANVTRDMTQRKRAEEKLAESEERFRAVADSAHEGIVSADSRGQINYFNQEAERLFGFSAAEAIGQPLTLLMPSKYHEPHQRGLERYVATGEVHVVGKTVELEGRRKDGREFPVELSISSWKTGGGVFFTAIIRDLTERKRAEEELRALNDELRERVRELEVVNKELESFSYSVSHDLRAPLRVIDGFAKILLETAAEQLDERSRHYLERVRASSQRMGELIDDLLNLARVTRSEIHPQTVDLSSLAAEIAEELRKSAPERKVQFVVSPGTVARGDSRLLRVVLENLMSNAWKFTGKHPKAKIEVGFETHEGRPSYFVRDDGAGFEMTYAGKLFGVFQRLHDPDEYEGTGIGLATVARIVHGHGGQVWAESEVERGATFYFTLGA